MESSVQNYENDNDEDPEHLFLNSIKSNATKHMYLYQTFSPNWKNWDFWKATKGQDSQTADNQAAKEGGTGRVSDLSPNTCYKWNRLQLIKKKNNIDGFKYH